MFGVWLNQWRVISNDIIALQVHLQVYGYLGDKTLPLMSPDNFHDFLSTTSFSVIQQESYINFSHSYPTVQPNNQVGICFIVIGYRLVTGYRFCQFFVCSIWPGMWLEWLVYISHEVPSLHLAIINAKKVGKIRNGRHLESCTYVRVIRLKSVILSCNVLLWST